MLQGPSRNQLLRSLAIRKSSVQKAQALSLPHVASGSSARPLATRTPTGHRTPTQGSEFSERQGDEDLQGVTPGTSIYPASKAAQRRHPHAPQLFQHIDRRNLGKKEFRTRQAPGPPNNDSYILRNVSSDPELKHLYTQLAQAANSSDAVHAVNIARLIKQRKQVLFGSVEEIKFDPEEKVVFLAIMRALSLHGFLQEAQAVSDDMQSFGFPECIDSLNHLLCAAVVSGNSEQVDQIIGRINGLVPRSSTPQAEKSSELADLLLNPDTQKSRPARPAVAQLPREYTRNWNAATFAHLVQSACQSHNLEVAFLLISSCYRLGLVLPHETLSRAITLCLHSNEFRIAVELADLIEQGGMVYRHDLATSEEASISRGAAARRASGGAGQVARRLAPSIWMSVLRACAEAGYLPGVELAWARAVVQGLLSPDDGLIQLILALSAKEGSIQMARRCLIHLDPSFESQESTSDAVAPEAVSSAAWTRRTSLPSQTTELQEWHLMPLFEAQCSSRDYAGAMRTLGDILRRGIPLTNRAASRISTSIYPDKAALQAAAEALARSGADESAGTHIAVVNAVISAAVWLGDISRALDIYRAIPSYQRLMSGKAEERGSSRQVRPNLETFNALLSGCIDTADYQTGVDLLKELNALRISPNEVTFERMIVLCLTQQNYENAFGFIEEAKERRIPPSRKSYEALARKCRDNSDHRWESVLADMSEQGYRPSHALLREFDLDPDAFQSPKTRRERR